jgi:uncharacterized damage-inducible protein DinB
MNNRETNHLASHLENTLNGEPWFGRSVFTLLSEVDASKAYKRPAGNSHSLADIVYHMITWASFTEKRLQRNREEDMAAFEKIDWRELDPNVHTWENAIKELKTIHENIIRLIRENDDSFLDEKVDYREYNFRFLVTGLTEHNIYHLGQVAYLMKLLS